MLLITVCNLNEHLVSSEGYIKPGDTLNYTINYENEGEGIAFGVYITDTLDEDLDDSTLVVENNPLEINIGTQDVLHNCMIMK